MIRASSLAFVVAGALASAATASPRALPASDALGANSAPAELAPVAQKDAGLDALAKKLKDPAEKERRSAVQDLAKLGSPAAWELVFDALKDLSPMVADEAQLQLGTLADVKLAELAFGKKGLESGDDGVRARVAEALGRMPAAIPLAELVKRLSDKDAGVRRALAWSLERIARANPTDVKARGAVPALAALGRLWAQDKDAGVRAAALCATGALETDHSEPIAEPLLADKAAEVRCAALLDALAWPVPVRFAAGAKLAADADHSVRAQAIETLASCGTKEASALLVDRLEKETSLRLRWRIVAELQKLSGSDLELNVPFWRKWVEGLDDAWHPATGEKKAPREVKEQGTTVFMGLPVLSDRVAILVDCSGSLWEKRADGKTRKETADAELAAFLKQLPPTAKFNVIPYTKTPFPWEKQLVPATKENVARALDAFLKFKETGKGNVWDAIELAITDPEVDSLLILTDGAPTGGRHWNLELMEPLLHEKLRFKKIAIDAVLVDAKKFLQERWRAICEGTGGRMHAVEMK